MRILLTGGAGYIGSHTAIVLTKLGHQVFLYDNLSTSGDNVVERLNYLTGQEMCFIRGDVLNTELLRRTLEANSIEAVIHFAGLKAVGESAKQPIDYFTNNIQGTISLLQAMNFVQIKKLVFSSSATVYGQPQYLPLDEYHPTGVTNPYGRSKLYIEGMLGDIVSSNSDWGIVCLRYFNPVGAHESGVIGEYPRGTPNNLMPYVAQVAIGCRSQLSIFGKDYSTPDGTGIRDYVHVMDLAEGHSAAIEYLINHNGLEVFNLGTGRGYSVLEIVKVFESVSDRLIPYHFEPRRPGDVAQCFASIGKAKRELMWSPKRDIVSMCDSAWKFQLSLKD